MFWAEVVNTVVHLINRGPSTPLNFKLPEEVWSGKNVDIWYLKVFVCVSYVIINAFARSKIDAKSKICYFVGYGVSEFGYCSWDDQNQKIIRSKDVVFNETVFYKDRALSFEAKKPMEIPLKIIPVFEVGESSGTKDQEIEAPKEIQTTPITELRRSSRIPKPLQRYFPALYYILLTDRGEPESFDEAIKDKESVKWELAMKDEMDSLMSNKTWQLAELPREKKALHNKWVYRIKEEYDDNKWYKARLVVEGFQQKKGIDYNEIFSPVMMLATIRTILTLVAWDDPYLE